MSLSLCVLSPYLAASLAVSLVQRRGPYCPLPLHASLFARSLLCSSAHVTSGCRGEGLRTTLMLAREKSHEERDRSRVPVPGSERGYRELLRNALNSLAFSLVLLSVALLLPDNSRLLSLLSASELSADKARTSTHSSSRSSKRNKQTRRQGHVTWDQSVKKRRCAHVITVCSLPPLLPLLSLQAV